MSEIKQTLKTEPVILVGILAEDAIHFELKGDFSFQLEKIPPGEYSVTSDDLETERTYFPLTQDSIFALKGVTIGIGFHWEQKEDQEFEGSLILRREDNKARAINAVPLESYLKSVISSEMSAMNDANLLNAHAIVSRSWLLAQIQNKTKPKQNSSFLSEQETIKWYDREDHTTFDVCADDHCQRYQGITKVISKNAQQAIEATRGMVLTYNNEICDARFSKCCGGISEDFENVWQPEKVPYLVAVRDTQTSAADSLAIASVNFQDFITTTPMAFCNTTDQHILSQVLIDFDRTTTNFYRWCITYRKEELAALLHKKSGIDFGEIIDLIPLSRGKSGRIIRLKIMGTKCERVVGKELEIRKWLSDSHLYSSAFVVEKNMHPGSKVPESFTLRGAGWGHGVGMCQIGAAVMSKLGYTATEIVEHYYRGSKVEKLY
jgi:stage II sporulation protein D